MRGTRKRHLRCTWRATVVASVLALWLTVGVAWGSNAALVFAFAVFVACVYGAWALLTGRLIQQAGGGYYRRQLDPYWNERRRTR